MTYLPKENDKFRSFNPQPKPWAKKQRSSIASLMGSFISCSHRATISRNQEQNLLCCWNYKISWIHLTKFLILKLVYWLGKNGIWNLEGGTYGWIQDAADNFKPQSHSGAPLPMEIACLSTSWD